MKTHNRKIEKPFSVVRFAATIAATFLLFALVFSVIAPKMWQMNIGSPLWKIALVFMVAEIVCCFAEWFFHRYILHASLFPFLRHFYEQHTLHHALTTVKLVRGSGEFSWVFNRYPIIEVRQHEASYFPYYALGAFLLASLPVVIPLQLLFGHTPIILPVSTAIGVSITLYETIHATEHLPYESFWRPKVEHRRFGALWRKIYLFHLRHHAGIEANEAVSGFFGFPLADFVFGTYASWEKIFSHKETVTEEMFVARRPRPRRFVRILDSWAGIGSP